jgi:hypothetical protein
MRKGRLDFLRRKHKRPPHRGGLFLFHFKQARDAALAYRVIGRRRRMQPESLQNLFGPGLRPQHPPSDAPAISVRLAEPPSVEGIGGGQTDEAAPGAAAAVVLAPWVEVSGISPGNSTGDCDAADAELVAPAAPLADPAVVADPADVPDCDADEGDDIEDKEDVDDKEEVDDSEGVDGRAGTPRGSDPVIVPLLLV